MDFARLTDKALMRVIARGRSEGVQELYDRYGRLVFSVVIQSLGDPAVAEEVTQEVFLQVWKNAAAYQADRGRVVTWLTSIARYRAIDQLRRRQARPQTYSVQWDESAAPQVPTDEVLEDLVELTQLRGRVREAVGQLPEAQKEVLALAFFQGRTHREISDDLELPLGTVKTRIRLAMQKLRLLLVQEQVSVDEEIR